MEPFITVRGIVEITDGRRSPTAIYSLDNPSVRYDCPNRDILKGFFRGQPVIAQVDNPALIRGGRGQKQSFVKSLRLDAFRLNFYELHAGKVQVTKDEWGVMEIKREDNYFLDQSLASMDVFFHYSQLPPQSPKDSSLIGQRLKGKLGINNGRLRINYLQPYVNVYYGMLKDVDTNTAYVRIWEGERRGEAVKIPFSEFPVNPQKRLNGLEVVFELDGKEPRNARICAFPT